MSRIAFKDSRTQNRKQLQRQFIADDPERLDFWEDRKNPAETTLREWGIDKMSGDEILAKLGHKAPPFHPHCRTTLITSLDISALSVKEAEQRARELGLPKEADYTGIPLKFVNGINNQLYELKWKYHTNYEKIETFEKEAEPILIAGREFLKIDMMLGSSSKLKINRKYFELYTEEQILINIEQAYNQRITNCKNFTDIVIHEFGHKLTTKKLLEIKQENPNSILKDYVTSEYFGLSDAETLAELFVLIHRKEITEEKIIELFNQFSEVKIVWYQ